MKDTIIANTGNSRYLKSGIDSDTTWAEFLQMLIAGTLPIDLNGLNAAGITQQGTLLNTANLLSAAACAALGLSQATAVPSDALVQLTKMATRENLLDNWYFQNAVNQRGGTSWVSGYSGITLDRWVKVNTGYTLTYEEGTGITFSRLTSGGYIRQYIDNRTYNAIKGKKITISVLCDSLSTGDSFRIVFCKHNTGGYHYISVENTGITSLTVDGPTEDYPTSYSTTFRPYFAFSLMDSCTATIRAVKLEVGENQTLARQVNGSWVLNDVPNYAEQLIRCKRFFQKVKISGCSGSYRNTSPRKAVIGIPLSVDMDESLRAATIYSWSLHDVQSSKGEDNVSGVSKSETKMSGVPNEAKDGSFSIDVSLNDATILNGGYCITATGVSIAITTE